MREPTFAHLVIIPFLSQVHIEWDREKCNKYESGRLCVNLLAGDQI